MDLYGRGDGRNWVEGGESIIRIHLYKKRKFLYQKLDGCSNYRGPAFFLFYPPDGGGLFVCLFGFFPT